MLEVITCPGQPRDGVARYWGRYYAETPRCSHAECHRVAHQVDSFFPYIDEYNRCDIHLTESSAGTIN